ncbi:MAG TPA: SDR family oxidoreductase [Dehalococcoidia bacterium]|jgi:3-oxoacyl-[acyl-carrier protein] reductase|nr:SDR family oxidoreductase [Dehalococcoidia bacterium]
MDYGLNGKAALVGGSSKGIGKAIAAALRREGCRVMLSSRDEGHLKEAAQEIRAQLGGEEVPYVVCDMSSADDIKRAVPTAARAFGGLDVLVNNAGGPPTGTFADLDDRYWQYAIDQNLLSVVRSVREALPHLRQSGRGRIVNVTSVAVKQPIDGLILSNATRLGVVGLAKTLSRELAPLGITVNNVCPGNIATQRLMSLIEERARAQGVEFEQLVAVEEARVPMGYLGEPEDVANLVAFLASDQARFITGTTIQVDGGSTTAVM